uniref:Uncharacterized protein n=1 Tax=Triticum urartu TaxID=4572 RepID=A0A8R7P9N3_TRIUA
SWSRAKHCNEDRDSRLMSTTNRQGHKDWTHWPTGIMEIIVGVTVNTVHGYGKWNKVDHSIP